MRIKRKASNYLVVFYLLGRACMPYLFSMPGASLAASELPLIALLGLVQVVNVEYEAAPRKTRL